MLRRAAIAISLAALALTGVAWTGSARAGDDPSCAQYREAMAYNACLARHGPKANNLGKLDGGGEPGRRGRGRDGWTGSRAPAARFTGWRGPQRAHGRVHMEFQVR
jgi:hypothetical protein